MHIFHKWGRWSKPYYIAYIEFQKRECIKCGRVQERMI